MEPLTFDFQPLTDRDYESLERCGISRDTADRAGLARVDSRTGAELVGRNGSEDYTGIPFPYFWPGSSEPSEYRLRRDNPPLERNSKGELKPKGKYLFPPGRSNRLYFGPNTQAEDLQNTELTVLVTEGCKQTLALDELSLWNSNKVRWIPIGLAGCWGWRGKTGIEPGPNGERNTVKGPISQLDSISWSGRKVIIVFDSDTQDNESVLSARMEISKELERRGAVVFHVNIPAKQGNKVGIDDYIGENGPQAGIDLIEAVEPFRPTFAPTEDGLAKRIVHHYGANIRHSPGIGPLGWDGKKWRPDDDGQGIRYARACIAQMYREAAELAASNPRQIENTPEAAAAEATIKSLVSGALKAQRHGFITGALSLAYTDEKVIVRPEALDSDPLLFNANNLTVDLRTGDAYKHRREDLITKISPVDYDPKAEAPRFIQFLQEIMNGSEELVLFLQLLFGYFLTGLIREHILPIFHGIGGNGKTLLLEILASIMGGYAAAADSETILVKPGGDGGSNFDIARLRGVRFVRISESDDSRRLAEGRVKQLTGGDRIVCRNLYQNFFEFSPQFKVVFTTNHKPTIHGQDFGTWRRVKLVPFNVVFGPDRQDTALLEKLKAESSGILNWAIEGCLKWQRQGLTDPEEVRIATQQYKNDEDIIGHFLSSVTTQNPGGFISTKSLYSAYRAWAEENGMRQMSQQRLGRLLNDRGIVSDRGYVNGKQQRIYLGISLLDEA